MKSDISTKSSPPSAAAPESARRARFVRSRSLLRGLQTVWTACGIALAVILPVELLLERVADDPRRLTRAELEPCFPGQSDDFYDQMSYEMQQTCFSSTSMQWQPFCYTRNPPFAGQYIGVDPNGLRKTWAAPSAANAGNQKLRLFFFGGSGMWGWENRDDFTIASLVAKQLAVEGIDVEAVNFGQRAYVSTQNVIALMQALHRNHVPDFVICYDGFNEIASGYANQASGQSLYELDRAREFNLLRKRAVTIFSQALANTGIARLFRGGSFEDLPIRTDRRWESREQMAKSIIGVYLANVRFTEALANSYGFKGIYCWQPCVFEKRALSEFEQAGIRDTGKMADIWKSVYAEARAIEARSRDKNVQGAPELLYLGDVFNTPQWDGRTAFADRAHLSEAANQVVADKLCERLRPLIAARQAAAPATDVPETP